MAEDIWMKYRGEVDTRKEIPPLHNQFFIDSIDKAVTNRIQLNTNMKQLEETDVIVTDITQEWIIAILYAYIAIFSVWNPGLSNFNATDDENIDSLRAKLNSREPNMSQTAVNVTGVGLKILEGIEFCLASNGENTGHKQDSDNPNGVYRDLENFRDSKYEEGKQNIGEEGFIPYLPENSSNMEFRSRNTGKHVDA